MEERMRTIISFILCQVNEDTQFNQLKCPLANQELKLSIKCRSAWKGEVGTWSYLLNSQQIHTYLETGLPGAVTLAFCPELFVTTMIDNNQ